MQYSTSPSEKFTSANKRGDRNGRLRQRELHQKQVKAHRRHARLDDDFAGGEPVQRATSVEHHLKRADGQRKRAEADPVQPHRVAVRGFLQKRQQADRRHDTERNIDVEDPAPTVMIGQPAAQYRAADRADHHPHGPDRHGGAPFLRRIDLVHHRLRQRHQRGAEHALHRAENHHLSQRLRHAAEDRGEGEAGDRGDEQARAAEPRGEEAGRRRHDRGGDDIAGQDPVDLFFTGGHRALHIGQRHVGDGAVQRLHQSCHHGAHHDDEADNADRRAGLRGRAVRHGVRGHAVGRGIRGHAVERGTITARPPTNARGSAGSAPACGPRRRFPRPRFRRARRPAHRAPWPPRGRRSPVLARSGR